MLCSSWGNFPGNTYLKKNVMTKENKNAGSSKLLKYKTYCVSPDGSYIEDDGEQLRIETDKDGHSAYNKALSMGQMLFLTTYSPTDIIV